MKPFLYTGKGYKLNLLDDFAGVNWTLSPWANGGGEHDTADYFATTVAGKLESIDLDQAVYWESPLLSICEPRHGDEKVKNPFHFSARHWAFF